jgi:hypothetical protein
MAKSWKDLLLSTGLPLENDVKKYLESRGCIASHEYTYLKPDEQGHEKQFSYDIDAAYIRGEFSRADDRVQISAPNSYVGVHSGRFWRPR